MAPLILVGSVLWALILNMVHNWYVLGFRLGDAVVGGFLIMACEACPLQQGYNKSPTIVGSILGPLILENPHLEKHGMTASMQASGFRGLCPSSTTPIPAVQASTKYESYSSMFLI